MIPEPRRPIDKQASSSRDRLTDSTLGTQESAGEQGVAAKAEIGGQIGRYQLERKLGGGGFGEVFLARDLELDRLVALKLLKARAGVSSEQADKELAEARAAARLDHPAITPIYDVGRTADGFRYMVSKWIEGTDLAALLQSARPGQRESARIIAEIADGLHFAHLEGFVHRDIKPANILLDKDRRPHLADFGLAVHEDDLVSRAGEMSGTPCYMAPEQAAGQTHHLDGRADIWSLGVILYELLTGRRPFRGQTVSQLFAEIRDRPARPCRQIDDTIPAELERIVLKCLAKDVEQRYLTAKDLANDLRAFLAGGDGGTSGLASSTVVPTASRQAKASFQWRGCLVTLTLTMGAVLIMIIAAPYLGRQAALLDSRNDSATRPLASGGGLPKGTIDEGGSATDLKSPGDSQSAGVAGSSEAPDPTERPPESRVENAITPDMQPVEPGSAAPPMPLNPPTPANVVTDAKPPLPPSGVELFTPEASGVESLHTPSRGVADGEAEKLLPFFADRNLLRMRGPELERIREAALEELVQREAEFPAAQFPNGHEKLLAALDRAAEALAAERRLDAAEELLERSVNMQQKLLGDSHVKVAESLYRLGVLRMAQGDLEGAEPYFEKSLAIQERSVGDASLGVQTLKSLVQLSEARGDADGAQRYRHQAQQLEEAVEPPSPEDSSLEDSPPEAPAAPDAPR